MKRLAMSAFALAAFATNAIGGEVELCNTTDAKLSYAAVARNSIVLAQASVASGWFTLEPGRCHTVAKRDGLHQVFVSVRKASGTQQHLISYAMKAHTGLENAITSGAERVFCVSDTSFKRHLVTLEDHEPPCPADYYEQVFNLYLAAKAGYNVKLNLQ